MTRQIYSIRANVEPGNSGGPLLAPDGKVDGVVFAAAVGVKDTGYALTASEVQSDVDRGAAATTPASTQTRPPLARACPPRAGSGPWGWSRPGWACPG